MNKQNAERETDFLMMRATPSRQKRTPPIYQKSWPVVTNNYFAPFRVLRMETVELSGEGSSTTMSETNHSLDKGRPPPTILTSEGNLISLKRQPKRIMTRELFFWKTAFITWIKTKCVVDYKDTQKFLRKISPYLHFTLRWTNLLKLLSGIRLAIFLQRTLLWLFRN